MLVEMLTSTSILKNNQVLSSKAESLYTLYIALMQREKKHISEVPTRLNNSIREDITNQDLRYRGA